MGLMLGRSRKAVAARKKQVRELWAQGLPARVIAERVGCSQSTVYGYISGVRKGIDQVDDVAVMAGMVVNKAKTGDFAPSDGQQTEFFPRLTRALGYYTHKDRSPKELASAALSLRAINSTISKHVKKATETLAEDYADDEPLTFSFVGVAPNGEEDSTEYTYTLCSNHEAEDLKSIEDKLWEGLARECDDADTTSPEDVWGKLREYAGGKYRNSQLLAEFGEVGKFYGTNEDMEAPGLRPAGEDDFDSLEQEDQDRAKQAWKECQEHAGEVLGLEKAKERGEPAVLNKKRARTDRLRQFTRLLADAEKVRQAASLVESRLSETARPGDVLRDINGAPLFMATSDVKRRKPQHEEVGKSLAAKLPEDTPLKDTIAVLRRVVVPSWKKDAPKDLAGVEKPTKTTRFHRVATPETEVDLAL